MLCKYVDSPVISFPPMVYYHRMVGVGHSRPSSPQSRVLAICKRLNISGRFAKNQQLEGFSRWLEVYVDTWPRRGGGMERRVMRTEENYLTRNNERLFVRLRHRI